ncbi:MAG TPA: FtsX-like permease family protein [Gaiellaceae bacterium]|nr:FtsX-like permease family protein [Gaiellaceae bacterium]
MRKVALKGLAGRKLRTLLTSLAIVLGVAMITGSFILTDSISKGFDSIFTSAYRNTDAVVSGKKLVDWSASGNATVDEALVARIRALPEVESASGSIIDIVGNSTQAKLIDRDGDPIQSSGNPTFGFGVDPSAGRFNPMRLVDGGWASGPGEIVIDKETADSKHFGVGDTIRASGQGPSRPFRIVGIASYGDVATLGGATFAVWDVTTARSMLGIAGYTGISVAARDGVSQRSLVASLQQAVPSNVQVRTGDEQAGEDKKGLDEFIAFIRGFLLAFGGIALLVGAFVIFNTLSITIAQRVRELATLRTLGASRRQVLRSVLLEAAAIGALASVVGILGGIGLARGLTAVFKALGLELPQSDPVYATRTFVIALIVGVGVTVVAGLAPALRATRVAPISAVREGAALPRRKRLGPVAGVVLLAAGVALVSYAVLTGSLGSGRNLLALAVGALLTLVGIAGVASQLVTALASLVGIPSRRLGGVAGRLAGENVVRNPARTASTAAALMIGLALVSFVAVIGKGVRDSLANSFSDQVSADYVITSQNGWSQFPAAAGDAIAKVDGVQASSIRSDRGLVGKEQVNVNAVDPATLDGMYRFEWKGGASDETLSRLDGNGAVLKESFARDSGLTVGERFRLRTPHGNGIELRVAGLYQPPRAAELLGGVVISQEAFDATFPRPQNQLTLVRGGSQEGLDEAVAAFSDAKVLTKDGYVDAQSSFIGQILNLLYVLLALSVIVSLFGMVNTLVLSVFERTRELGMLRAVGMTRRQVRRLVRHESVITALIGAGLGLPLGVALGAAVTHALDRYGVEFALPVASLAAFTVVAIVAGILAAVLPARRASRLDVLSALQYE